jgi:hypothetical protein
LNLLYWVCYKFACRQFKCNSSIWVHDGNKCLCGAQHSSICKSLYLNDRNLSSYQPLCISTAKQIFNILILQENKVQCNVVTWVPGFVFTIQMHKCMCLPSVFKMNASSLFMCFHVDVSMILINFRWQMCIPSVCSPSPHLHK